jgi:hypothetical protein
LQKFAACQDLPTLQFWSKSNYPFWSYCPFFIKMFSIFNGRTTDDGRRTDDGRQVMAIPHMTLWVRWAKNWPCDCATIYPLNYYFCWYLCNVLTGHIWGSIVFLGNNSKTVDKNRNLTWDKNDQHSKIYIPCNFEVNPITHFGQSKLNIYLL